MLEKEDKSYYTNRSTEHYEYILNIDIRQQRGFYTTAHLHVGSKTDPCLSISVPLMGMLEGNNRYDKNELSIARLNKIKKLDECIVSSKPNAPSFAKEMLNDVMYVIRQNYPHIHHIQLSDDSEIPCGEHDKFGLMYYSVGLHKKTWYELSFNAYFLPRDKFIQYKCAVERYADANTKASWDWNTFYRDVRMMGNEFAITTIGEKADEYAELYNKSTTFPEFFVKLSKSIPAEHKCRFFRGWLETFIESFVVIPRIWYIDLYTVKLKQTFGGSNNNRKTRRRRRTMA